METLPSFQSLLNSTATTAGSSAAGPNSNSCAAAGHYPLSDVGSSPFFSSSSSFFSSSSSFFSSSGELSSLLLSSSSRRGRESPVAPSSPRQMSLSLPSTPSTPALTTFLGSFATTTTHTAMVCERPPTYTLTLSPAASSTLPNSYSAVLPGPAPPMLPLPAPPMLPLPAPHTLPMAYRTTASAVPATAPNHVGAATPSPLLVLKDDSRVKKESVNAGNKPAAPGVRTCTMCGTSKTKQWRSGSDGKPSLCNACGLRYRKDSLGQKFKFKQVIIFPSGTSATRKRKVALGDEKSKPDSVDEKELVACLQATAKPSSSTSTKRRRRRHSEPDTAEIAKADAEATRSREGSPDRRSDIYSLLN